MDLFDLGNYFGSYVPVQAHSHPLLKHAACAYAAKQLGRSKDARCDETNFSQVTMRSWDGRTMDWEWVGAYHYDKSIAMLRDIMQQSQTISPLVNHDLMDGSWKSPESVTVADTTIGPRSGESMVQLGSDGVAAAAAILCGYEALSAAGAAWSRHLNGTKSLLDFAEGNAVPLEMPSLDRLLQPQHKSPSRARKATFWNFARVSWFVFNFFFI